MHFRTYVDINYFYYLPITNSFMKLCCVLLNALCTCTNASSVRPEPYEKSATFQSMEKCKQARFGANHCASNLKRWIYFPGKNYGDVAKVK
jgi:hypothetical protein